MFLLIILLTLPYKLNSQLSRAFVTIATSQMLIVNQISAHAFVSQFLCYVGDISYSVYLIHWPVIVFYKYIFYTPGKF